LIVFEVDVSVAFIIVLGLPEEFPVLNQVGIVVFSVYSVHIEDDCTVFLVNRWNTNDKFSIVSRGAVGLSDSKNVCPGVYRVSISPKTGVFHRRESKDEIKLVQRSIKISPPEGGWSHHRPVRQVTLKSIVIHCSHMTRRLGHQESLNPGLRSADDEYHFIGDIQVRRGLLQENMSFEITVRKISSKIKFLV